MRIVVEGVLEKTSMANLGMNQSLNNHVAELAECKELKEIRYEKRN